MQSITWPLGDEVRVEFGEVNKKQEGSKAWDRYDKYKGAGTAGEARFKGAENTDLKSDFRRGFMAVQGTDGQWVVGDGKTKGEVAESLGRSPMREGGGRETQEG